MLLEGAGLANVAGRRTTRRSSPTRSRSRSSASTSRRARSGKSMLLTLVGRGRRRRHLDASRSRRRRRRPACTIDVPGTVDARPRRRRRDPGRRPRGRRRRRPARTTASSSSAGTASSAASRTRSSSSAPRSATRPSTQLKKFQTGDTANGHEPRLVYCCPAEPFGPPPDYTGAPMNEDGSEHLYYVDIDRADRQLRRLGARRVGRRADRPVRARLEGRERRPGLRGHPDRRERAHLRREHRRRRSGRAVPAAAALLRLGRLARRRVHEQVAEGAVPPERVGRTT